MAIPVYSSTSNSLPPSRYQDPPASGGVIALTAGEFSGSGSQLKCSDVDRVVTLTTHSRINGTLSL